MQQSKLAALGRLSASIAHEIRNPVGAMSHAAQLLAEAPTLTPQERRLTYIITSNGERVSTIIDNVLQLSRRDSTRQERIEINGWLKEFLAEFRQTAQVDEQTLQLRFRRSGHRCARRSDAPASTAVESVRERAEVRPRRTTQIAPIELRTGRMAGSDRPYPGSAGSRPGHSAGRRRTHLRAVLHSAGQGGTGLGLFIARELAQCNRAILVYEPRTGGGSIFRVVFADPQRWETQ